MGNLWGQYCFIINNPLSIKKTFVPINSLLIPYNFPITSNMQIYFSWSKTSLNTTKVVNILYNTSFFEKNFTFF